MKNKDLNTKINALNLKFGLGLVLLLHLVGLIGIGVFQSQAIIALSWANLLVGVLVGLWFFKGNLKPLIGILIILFGIGFFAEAIGVNTGYLFGNYTYGDVLGPKFLGVPLMIGLMWLTLSIGSKNLIGRFIRNQNLGTLLSALLMVGFDITMEPVAIALGYWTWHGAGIPMLNYYSWFFVALLIQFLLWRYPTKNQIFESLFIIQLVFFLCLNFLL